MLRFLRISAFVATFLLATASSVATSEKPHYPAVPTGATATVAVGISSGKFADCAEVSAARQSFALQPQTIRYLVGLSSLWTLPLKTHRRDERVAVAGHIKYRHASNAPPLQFC